jgi:transposase
MLDPKNILAVDLGEKHIATTVLLRSTCHKCGQIGERLSQGVFRCPSCNIVYNADLNGGINIAKRFSSYMLESGASLATPANFPRVK